MREILEDILKKLNDKAYRNEEHVRLSLVSRILQELDWDLWNPNEVNSEFPVVPNEDQSRVDLALFLTPYVPSVFVEIKAVGKLEGDIGHIEQQLRDYNRNNTALFSVISDGRKWRFYYSQTGGEFSQKCFRTLDLIEDDIEDVELTLHTFLSKSEIHNGNAKVAAEGYLRLNQKQRAMEDALSKARRMILEPPYPTLLGAIVQLVTEAGFSISEKEAARFINKFGTKKLPIETPTKKSIEKPRIKHISTDGIDTGQTLRDILKNRDLPIFFRYKGITHEAYIPKQAYSKTPKIIYEGKEYSSPSNAAVAVLQKYTDRKTEDGWKVWKYEDLKTGQLVPIDNLREKPIFSN